MNPQLKWANDTKVFHLTLCAMHQPKCSILHNITKKYHNANKLIGCVIMVGKYHAFVPIMKSPAPFLSALEASHLSQSGKYLLVSA